MSLIRGIFEDNEVSINYIVDRDGSVLCYIPEDRAAWHAGKGTFGGDERFTDAMNKYSIGIEIVAIGSQKDMAQYMSAQEYNELDDSLKGFTDEQYLSLKALVKDICQRNGIPFDKEHVIGHDMYNPQKNDPGELFDYNRIFE
jgi:N-acetyl-anhydromuramyl-L-alanine amidase AmpD